MRYAMVIDTVRCVGCNACVVACKTENNTPEGFARDWLRYVVSGTFPDLTREIYSERCNHCDNPPSVHNCPTGASQIVEGGLVVVDRSKCTGCKACVASCPYNARYVHPDGHVDKCTFCIHRVRRGLDPACVSSCPTEAMTFGDVDDPDSEVSRLIRSRKVRVNNPASGCDPQVYYLT